MKKIDISTKKYPNTFTLVDNEDYEELNKYKWRAARDWSYTLYVERSIKINGKYINIKMHRVILKCENKFVIDHKNHNTLDNTKQNLRICTQSQNLQNKIKSKSTKNAYKGVTKNRNRWRATITKNYKRTHIGCYETQEFAAFAYNKKALELFGEFAYLNIIKDAV